MPEHGYTIGQMNLSLPAGMTHRADRIARSTASELARLEPTANARLDVISMPPLVLRRGEADGVLARRIAHAISDAVTRQQANGGPAGA